MSNPGEKKNLPIGDACPLTEAERADAVTALRAFHWELYSMEKDGEITEEESMRMGMNLPRVIAWLETPSGGETLADHPEWWG